MQIERIYPASKMQASIIAGYLASNRKDYLGQVTVPISKVDYQSLNQALYQLYQRHEALRTAFDWQNQNGITAVVASKLPIENFINQYTAESIKEIDQVKRREAELVSLNKPPLVRLALLNCSEKHYLLWTRHHAITDQESIKIFWTELWHFYRNPNYQLPKTKPFSDFAYIKASNQVNAPTYHDYLPLIEDARIENHYTLQPSELTRISKIQKGSNVTLAAYTLSAFGLALTDILESECFTISYIESDRPEEYNNSIGLYIKESFIRQDQEEFVTAGDHRQYIFKSVLCQRNSNYEQSHEGGKSQIGFLFEDDPDSQSVVTLEDDAGISVRLKLFCRFSVYDGKLSIHLSSQTKAIRKAELDALQNKLLRYLLMHNDTNINHFEQSPRQYLINLMWIKWRHNKDIVLADNTCSLTGEELYLKVKQKAKYIRTFSTKATNQAILIKPARSVECVINILASIDVGLPFLLTDKSVFSKPSRVLSEDLSISSVDTHLPANTIYMIRTSGSTGVPKTILIHTKNLISHLEYRISQSLYSSRVAHTSAWSFDASLTVLFSTMAKNGFLYIFPMITEFENSTEFFKSISNLNIQEINMVPSLLRLLINYGLAKTSINKITSAGEKLTPDLARLIINDSSVQLFNEYGPSECTILSTATQITNFDLQNLTIGKPVDGCTIKLYSNDNSSNEICISGMNVGLGYFKDQNKNKRTFFYDQGHLWYRSGDDACYTNNDNLQWLGRIDNQFKYNGKMYNSYMLEHELMKYGVEECSCIWLNSVVNVFYTCKRISSFDHELLKLNFRKGVELPCQFHYLPNLPKTHSGKIDTLELRKCITTSLEDTRSRNKDKVHLFIESIVGRPIDLNTTPFHELDSLQAIRLISSINGNFNMNISVVTLISSSSWGKFIAMISIDIQQAQSNGSQNQIIIKKREYK